MKTRKRKLGQAIDGVPGLDATSETPQSATESSQEKADRLSFFMSAEGVPDWERMIPATRERLASVLQNPKVQKELGFSKEEARTISEIGFGDDEANALLDILGSIDSFAASAIYKVPPDICSKAFTFTPDQRKKISPPMQRVLNKWAPMILKTWKDEIGLGMVLLATLNAQVRVMHILDEQRKKNTPQKAPATVTPISGTANPPATDAVAKDETPKADWPENSPVIQSS
jgi:hypothetical protein